MALSSEVIRSPEEQLDFDAGYDDGLRDAPWPHDYPTPAYFAGRMRGTAERKQAA